MRHLNDCIVYDYRLTSFGVNPLFLGSLHLNFYKLEQRNALSSSGDDPRFDDNSNTPLVIIINVRSSWYQVIDVKYMDWFFIFKKISQTCFFLRNWCVFTRTIRIEKVCKKCVKRFLNWIMNLVCQNKWSLWFYLVTHFW